ncbi:g643 [Coccomyxa elongata]
MTDSLEDVRSFIHPSTIVYTRRGPKEISDVCPGDEVVAQTGAFVAVAIVHRKPYRGLLLDIGGRGQVHEHHRLLQADDTFVQADELRAGDVLRGIVPRYTEDIPELTEEDCLLYGVMMVSAKVDRDNVVTLRHNMLTSAAEETMKAGGVNFMHDQGADTLVFMSPFRREMLLDERLRMRFHAPLLHLPEAKLKKLQQGLWYGSMASSDPADGDRCIAVSDRALAEAIRYIFLRTGTDLEYDGEVLRKPPGPIVEGSTGCVDRKIRSIAREEFSGELFDLETTGDCDEERTYLTNIGASHNGGGRYFQ